MTEEKQTNDSTLLRPKRRSQRSREDGSKGGEFINPPPQLSLLFNPAGMDGKGFSNEQQAQQKNPDALTDGAPRQDQEALDPFPDSDDGNTSPFNGHEADVNMEAAISTEDVIRAGGFGAKDDIGSLLPTAIDSTDFEASLRDARDFEGEKEAPSHPGLGWKGEKADDGSKPPDVPQQ